MLKLYKRLYKERTPARTRKLGGKISFLCERVHIQECNKQQWIGKNFHTFEQIFEKNQGNILLSIHLQTFAILVYQNSRGAPPTTILIKLGAPCHFFSLPLSHLRKRFLKVYIPPKAFKYIVHNLNQGRLSVPLSMNFWKSYKGGGESFPIQKISLQIQCWSS